MGPGTNPQPSAKPRINTLFVCHLSTIINADFHRRRWATATAAQCLTATGSPQGAAGVKGRGCAAEWPVEE